LPALRPGQTMDAQSYALARELTHWKREIRKSWEQVAVQVAGQREGAIAVGEPIHVTALVALGTLRPNDVRVELVAGRDDNGTPRVEHVVPMERVGKPQDGIHRYQARLLPETSGSLVEGVGLIPPHPGLEHPSDMGWPCWP